MRTIEIMTLYHKFLGTLGTLRTSFEDSRNYDGITSFFWKAQNARNKLMQTVDILIIQHSCLRTLTTL